jgi:hypothetical protein
MNFQTSAEHSGPRSHARRITPALPRSSRRAAAEPRLPAPPSRRFAISRSRHDHLCTPPEQITQGARSSAYGTPASAVAGSPPRRPLVALLRRLLPRPGPLLSSFSSFEAKPQCPIASLAIYQSQLLPPRSSACLRQTSIVVVAASSLLRQLPPSARPSNLSPRCHSSSPHHLFPCIASFLTRVCAAATSPPLLTGATSGHATTTNRTLVSPIEALSHLIASSSHTSPSVRSPHR